MQNATDPPSLSTAIDLRTNAVDAPATDGDSQTGGGHPGVSCFGVLFTATLKIVHQLRELRPIPPCPLWMMCWAQVWMMP